MSSLSVDADDPPDLTDTLQQGSKRLAGSGSFGTVYRCLCTQNGEVAVKAISFPASISRTDRDEFLRKMKRELGIWKRLDHPNIVLLLGIALGDDFGSDHHCMVSMWMPHGTLADYVTRPENELSLPSRIQLIRGSAAGLEYLHSLSIVHGDFHPGNIMIDKDHNPRLIDFGFSQTGLPQENLSYLWTDTIRAGAAMWVAPELRCPELFRDLMTDVKDETRLASDIYSLGSIILFTLSGKSPWTTEEFARRSNELQNPPRPPWPVILDVVWSFIERCWSPRDPRSRPLAQEVLSFCRDRLQDLLQPNPAADINVVLFGAVGCGKSSIINLLQAAEEGLAPVSANKEPCTTRPQCYPVPVGQRKFRLWDTTGFRLSQQSGISHLPPYEQAHSVLQNLRDGVHLVLLCARKDEISRSLGSLYWLINNFFFGGHAPVALVVTHFDTLDKWWWGGNQRSIMGQTGIPIQSIPHVCITTVPSGRDESRQTLRAFLTNCSNLAAPIPLCLDLSSRNSASRSIASHCHLSNYDATALVEKFSQPHTSPRVGEQNVPQPHQVAAKDNLFCFSSADLPPPPDLTPYISKADADYVAAGDFGDVYRGCYTDGSTSKEVAVKAFRSQFIARSHQDPEMARREIGIWRRLDHPNIVPFLGLAYGFGMGGTVSLVSLWMPNGPLSDFLGMYDDTLGVIHRFQLLCDIANGLHYLHSSSIVHGDLNSRNILVDADYTVRLVDFGSASLLGNVPGEFSYLQRSDMRPGALRWVAPEQITSLETFCLTTKSDIYSFGCVTLHVLSGERPWSEIREDIAVILCLAKGQNPGRPESRAMDDSHWNFIQSCWLPVEDRPTAQAMISTIGRFLSHCPPSLPLQDLFRAVPSPPVDEIGLLSE